MCEQLEMFNKATLVLPEKLENLFKFLYDPRKVSNKTLEEYLNSIRFWINKYYENNPEMDENDPVHVVFIDANECIYGVDMTIYIKLKDCSFYYS